MHNATDLLGSFQARGQVVDHTAADHMHQKGVLENKADNYQSAALCFQHEHALRPRIAAMLSVANMRLKMADGKDAAEIYQAVIDHQQTTDAERQMAKRKLALAHRQLALDEPNTNGADTDKHSRQTATVSHSVQEEYSFSSKHQSATARDPMLSKLVPSVGTSAADPQAVAYFSPEYDSEACYSSQASRDARVDGRGLVQLPENGYASMAVSPGTGERWTRENTPPTAMPRESIGLADVSVSDKFVRNVPENGNTESSPAGLSQLAEAISSARRESDTLILQQQLLAEREASFDEEIQRLRNEHTKALSQLRREVAEMAQEAGDIMSNSKSDRKALIVAAREREDSLERMLKEMTKTVKQEVQRADRATQKLARVESQLECALKDKNRLEDALLRLQVVDSTNSKASQDGREGAAQRSSAGVTDIAQGKVGRMTPRPSGVFNAHDSPVNVPSSKPDMSSSADALPPPPPPPPKSTPPSDGTNVTNYVSRLIRRANREDDVSVEDASRATEAFEEARSANDAGDFQRAVEAFEQSYLLNPRPSTLVSTANMYLKMRNTSIASEIYNRLLSQPLPEGMRNVVLRKLAEASVL